MIRVEIKNHKMILTEKQQKNLDYRSGKIDIFEYLASENMLPSDQSRTIEQAMFTYSP